MRGACFFVTLRKMGKFPKFRTHAHAGITSLQFARIHAHWAKTHTGLTDLLLEEFFLMSSCPRTHGLTLLNIRPISD